MKNLIIMLKQLALSFVVLLLVYSCQKDNVFDGNDYEGGALNGVNTRKVTLDDLPHVKSYFFSDLEEKVQTSHRSFDNIYFPYGTILTDHITEVTDSLGNTNYTFLMIPKTFSDTTIFNYVVYADATNNALTSFIYKYQMEDAFAEAFKNGTKDFSQFTGSVTKYSVDDLYFASNNRFQLSPCEAEETNDGNLDDNLPPCEEDTIYNGVGNGGGGDPLNDNGSNEGYGDPTGGSGLDCVSTLYVVNCGGTNSSTPHVAHTCGGPNQATADYFIDIECSFSNLAPGRTRINGCNGGSILNINPISIESVEHVLELDESEANCLDANCDLKNDILEYLNANADYSSKPFYDQATLDFANAVVDQIAANCDVDFEVDFELEMVLEITETLDFQNQTCLKSIKDDVVSTGYLSKVIKKFEPTHPVLHLEWGIFSSSQWGNTGNTSLNSEQDTAFINFNVQSLTHVNNIVMVNTIAHEVIHAELLRKLKELVDDYNIISFEEYTALENNFLGIADYTFSYGEVIADVTAGQITAWGLDPDFSLAHHNQMAAFYRQTLIDVMKAYDLSKGITRPNADEFYEALSWAGLRITSDENGENNQYTDAWKNFKNQIDIDEANIPVPQRTYNRYINIINQEYSGSGINCD